MVSLRDKLVACGLADASRAAMIDDLAARKLQVESARSIVRHAMRVDDDLAAVRREKHRQIQEAKRRARETYAQQATVAPPLPPVQPIEYLDRDVWKEKAKILGNKILVASPRLRGAEFRLAVEKAMRAAGYALRVEAA